MEQQFVKVVKLSERDDAKVPNNIPVGKVSYGAYYTPPEVGEPFITWPIGEEPDMQGIRTSRVQGVNEDGTFLTKNSTYQWRLITREEIPTPEQRQFEQTALKIASMSTYGALGKADDQRCPNCGDVLNAQGGCASNCGLGADDLHF